uniref:PAS domain-containing protein n=1 Tax=Kryptolebias marmoratus TaxID=37003 RepID=A0A3Q2ZCQ3_KRYMA
RGLGEKESPGPGKGLSCLVTMCRLHPNVSHQPPRDVHVKATEFVTRCAIDGKFTFVDQQATTVIGYLPQEVLGTSCYEYFHQDDLQHLAGKHRQVLRSKEKVETQRYKFKTKYGSYVSLQSQWAGFTNPWTKEIEFIVSLNRIEAALSARVIIPAAGVIWIVFSASTEDTKQIPEIPGLSAGVGMMIYAGSIGTQIANELIDSYRYIPSELICKKVLRRTVCSPGSKEIKTTRSFLFSCSVRFYPDESSQLGLDGMVVPGLSSFSSDEAAMEVIWRLLETDVSMGQSADFEDLHWPF